MKSTLIRRLADHLQSTPNKIILQDSSRNWSWAELFKRSNDYARVIRETSFENRIMPFLADRSGESVAAMLGCLMSDVAFAPLSPNQPLERLEKCLKALGSTKLLSTTPTQPGLHLAGVTVVHPAIASSEAVVTQSTYFKDREIIYVLFTSGSTGTPKGVLVSAGNIENTMLWSQDILDWHETDVMGGATNFFFDISIFDLFTMLYFNVTLALYSNTADVTLVAQESLLFGVTSIFSVPLFFSQLARLEMSGETARFPKLRRIISGGDFFPPQHLLTWLEKSPHTQIYNVWGPTETSIVNTMHLISPSDHDLLRMGKSPPVGRSHVRMEFALVAEDRQRVLRTPGEVGEIAMLGECVSQGYLGAPELTSKAYGEIEGKRCYFTEDLGRVDELGNLFITGRLGATVKVSGYRVDLGEIDALASTYADAHLVSTFLKKINDDISELWLVVEPKDFKKEFDVFDYKNFLRTQLPHYMVPKRIFLTQKLPLNANGKIDRNKVREGCYE